jgi:hypothetical protein
VDRRPGRADRRRSLDQPAHPPALIHDRPQLPSRWPRAGRCRFSFAGGFGEAAAASPTPGAATRMNRTPRAGAAPTKVAAISRR